MANFTTQLWLLVFIGAFIIGLAKAGLKGIEMLNVTIMALVFGGKASTGVVLPLLCIADILAVIYYNRHAQWSHFWRLIPYILGGILIGVYAGNVMNEAIFKKIMAIIILSTVSIMIWIEYRKSETVPNSRFFVIIMGLTTGITTMLGNLAGSFANIYFLSLRTPKNDFIGTAAWLFLVINLTKIPFQVFVWKNITLETLKLDLYLIPAIFLGFFVGIKLVAYIKEIYYRKVILALTLIGAIMIFLR
jgi:uncharacterized protein